MNFTTQCLDMAARMLTAGYDAPVFVNMMDALLRAHKMLLPPPRNLRAKVLLPQVPYIRMVFPEVVFEYEVPDSVDTAPINSQGINTSKSSSRLVLALDLERSVSPLALALKATLRQPAEIAFVVWYYIDHMKAWMPSMGVGLFHRDNQTSVFYLDGHTHKYVADVGPLLPMMVAAELRDGHSGITEATLMDFLMNDIMEDVGVALRALALVNTRNLRTVLAVKAPKNLNAKRAAKHKPPFFDYHTLDIFLVDDQSLLGRKKLVTTADIRAVFAARGKLREVIGHFKNRKTGIFWWNSFIAGDARRGATIVNHRIRT